MRISAILTGAALAFASASAANAAVVVGEAQEGNSYTINFTGLNGEVPTAAPELQAVLDLTFLTRSDNGRVFTFSYTIDNNSTVDSRLTGIGFNAAENVSGGTATGTFGAAKTNRNFPVGVGTVDFCLNGNVNGNSCAGGGNTGVTSGNTGSGTFTVTLAESADQLTIEEFFVRFQSINPALNGSDSGVGIEAAVPEPSAWLMMILGFAAVGGMMRQRKQSVKVTYA